MANIVDVNFLAKFFRKDVRTIQNYAKKGMPREGKGQYDFNKCCDWYIKHLEAELLAAKHGDETEAHARARLLTYRANLAEIELAKKRAEVITVEDAEQELQRILKAINTKIRAYPRGSSVELSGIDTPAQIEEYLNQTLVNDLLNETYSISDRLTRIAEHQKIDTALLENTPAADEEKNQRTRGTRTRNDNRRRKRGGKVA